MNPSTQRDVNTLEYAAPAFRGRRRMRVQVLVLFVWLPIAMVGMMLGLYGCLTYNQHAGTDLTKTEMALITLSMNSGPFVGPLRGRSAFNDFYGRLIPASLGVLALAWVPTLLVRKPLNPGWRIAFVLLHLGAAAAWYLSAFLSLACHLS